MGWLQDLVMDRATNVAGTPSVSIMQQQMMNQSPTAAFYKNLPEMQEKMYKFGMGTEISPYAQKLLESSKYRQAIGMGQGIQDVRAAGQSGMQQAAMYGGLAGGGRERFWSNMSNQETMARQRMRQEGRTSEMDILTQDEARRQQMLQGLYGTAAKAYAAERSAQAMTPEEPKGFIEQLMPWSWF